MPKKAQKGGGGKKKQKAKPNQNDQKVKVDKTFGLKNKKGKKAAAIINAQNPVNMSKQYQIEKEARKEADRARAQNEARRKAAEREKKLQLEKLQRENDERLLKAKTLCEDFKKGLCDKGITCEYLHDWSQVDRAEKLDPYVDPRRGTENEPNEKALICNYFLTAVKEKKYGFFWNCPNKGVQCQYKHSLPPGYSLVVRAPKKSLDEQNEDDQLTLEEEIDFARNEILEKGENTTKITKEIFLEWNSKRISEKNGQKEKLNFESKSTGKQFFISSKTQNEISTEKNEAKFSEEEIFDEKVFCEEDDVLDIDLEELKF